MLKRLIRNLLPRLHLLKIALTSRFINSEIIELARRMGIEYRDVKGDVEPFEMFAQLGIGYGDDLPNFDEALGTSQEFTPNEAPRLFNSEPSVGHFLGSLTHCLRAETIIELGCFVGWTTAHMALSMTQTGRGKIYAVDASAIYLDTMMANMRRLHLDKCVTPIKGYSTDSTTLEALPQAADIIFLDTSHAYPATLEEIHLYAPRLRKDGYFVLHDSTSAPGVRRSLMELQGFRKLTFATEYGNGVTVLKRL